jgi:Uma2 family endonuclease
MGKLLERPRKTKAPPLIDGDSLSVEEFLRRYEACPEGFHAELLDGIVHVTSTTIENSNGKVIHTMMASPRFHGRQQFTLTLVLGAYVQQTPGIEGLSPSSLVLPDGTSVPEPDLLLCVDPDAGGGTHDGPRDALYGVPELIVEIANTSEFKDLGQKKNLYQRNQIPEYLVWRTRRKKIMLFTLEDNSYRQLEPSADGILKSRSYPGLWLDTTALVDNRSFDAIQTLSAGLASPEHARFVEKLRKIKAKKK